MHEPKRSQRARCVPARPSSSGRARITLLLELVAIAALSLFFGRWWLRSGSRSKGIVEVGDEQVAVVLDFWSGAQREVTTPGYELVVPELQEVYALDRSPVEYLMFGPDRKSSNHVPRLVVRSRDGSTFWFERVAIQYGLDPSRLDLVLQDSGPDDAFKDGFVDAFARAVLLAEFGRYTAEEIVSPEAVQGATRAAQERLNALLAPHAIEVYEIAASKPAFDKRYEDTIERRKVAEQEIEALRAKAELLETGKDAALAETAGKLAIELEKARAKWQQELADLEQDAARLRAGQAEELAQLERYQQVTLEKARQEWRQEVDAQQRATLALEVDVDRARDARRRAAGLELEAARVEWTRERELLEREAGARTARHEARLASLGRAHALALEELAGADARALAEAEATALGAEHEAEQYHAARALAGELQLAQHRGRAAVLTDEYQRAHEAFVARARGLAQNGAVAVRAALVAKLRSIAFEIAPFTTEAEAPERARRATAASAN